MTHAFNLMVRGSVLGEQRATTEYQQNPRKHTKMRDVKKVHPLYHILDTLRVTKMNTHIHIRRDTPDALPYELSVQLGTEDTDVLC